MPAPNAQQTMNGRGSGRFARGVFSGGVPIFGYGMPVKQGRTFHVNNSLTTASANNSGLDPAKPLTTLMLAIAKCVAGRGDMIILGEGHAENYASAAAVSVTKAGIAIAGIGDGEKRPTFTSITSTAATFAINAANVRMSNILFKTNIDSQVIALDINSTDFTAEYCEFREGTAKQTLTYIDINGGGANACDRATIRKCKITSYSAGADRGIELGEVADNVVIEDCRIEGDFSDAGIHNPTGKVMTHFMIQNCAVKNLQTGDHAIELVSACTGWALDNELYGDTLGTILDPGSLRCLNNTEQDTIDQRAQQSPHTGGPFNARAIARPTSNLAQSGTLDIFTVTGPCKIVSIFGRVTTVVQTQADNAKLIAHMANADVDMCAVLDITAVPVGSLLGITGTFATAMQKGDAIVGQSTSTFVSTGTIRLSCAASNTGQVAWTVVYEPLEPGSKIVAA